MADDLSPPIPSLFQPPARTPPTATGCDTGIPPTQPSPADRPLPPFGLPAVPGYAIHGEIARGGMGAVLRGEDLRLGRELAVKVLLEKCQGEAAQIARFVAEARLQGRLQHPGIVPVHELGEYAPGRPFFSMKLVQGRTLAELLKDRPLPGSDLPRFVQLFEQVSQAVAYAHAQGVIHRDLKPGNIMVGAFGEVQVMDWGLAKVVGRPAAPCYGPEAIRSASSLVEGPTAEAERAAESETLARRDGPCLRTPSAPGSLEGTQDGAILGTPAYMAPEQARGEIDRLDTRTDVFALGALLCEILTRKPAYAGPSTLDMLVQAQEGDLRDAWARLDGCGADADLVALARACLTEAPPGRPADAGAVAQAVAAYRAGVQERLRAAEVAQAAAEARAQEESKTRAAVEARLTAEQGRLAAERRVRRLVAGGALGALLAAVGASGLAGWALMEKGRADAQTEVAQAEQARAVQAAGRERRAAAEATQQARFATEVSDFLCRDLLGLTGVKGQMARKMAGNKDITLREVLDRAARKLDDGQRFEDQPLIEAAIRDTVGSACLDLGEVRQAVPHLERALCLRRERLGSDHPSTLTSMNNLAVAYNDAGRPKQAIPLAEEALQRRRATLGADHPDTLTCLSNLVAVYNAAGQWVKALPLAEEALRRRTATLGPDHPDTLVSLNNLALAYKNAGRPAQALTLLEAALRSLNTTLGVNHPETLTCLSNLATCYHAAGQWVKALPLAEEALRRQTATLGPDHPDTLISLNNLANIHRAAGQLAKALEVDEEALRLLRSKLGADHPSTVTSMSNLAASYQAAGLHAQAMPLMEETLKLRKARLGPNHPDTLLSMSNLAAGYRLAGQLDRALPLHEETWRRRQAALGADHPDTLESMNNVALTHADANRLDLAIPLYEEVLRQRRARLGVDHPDTLTSLSNLAMAYRKARRLAEAVPLAEETLRQMQAQLGVDHPLSLTAMNNLARTYQDTGRMSEALPLLEEALQRKRGKLGADHPSTLLSQANLGVAYRDVGRLAEAISLLEDAFRRGQPNVSLNWGGALLDAYLRDGQKAKAIPLVQASLATARKILPADSPQLAAQLAIAGSHLLDLDACAEAEPILRECLTLREKLAAADKPAVAAWQVANTRSMLGAALVGQGKHAEAEPLLVQGWEGLKAQEKTIPPQGRANLPAALARLVRLYEAQAKPQAAEPYRAELARRLTAELNRGLAWPLLWGWPR